MSANNGNPDTSYPAGFSPSPSFDPRGKTSYGMDLPPLGYSPHSQLNEIRRESPSMSTLALRASSVLPSARDLMWNHRDRRPSMELSSRPSPPERVELPSIRQAVPEIQMMRTGRGAETEYRPHPTSYSPSDGLGTLITLPEYVQSPSLYKRRRLSTEDGYELEARDHVVRRICSSPTRPDLSQSAALSPTASTRQPCALSSSTESWSSSTRTSPYTSTQRLAEIRSPPQIDSSSNPHPEWRPMLPSLPSLDFERGSSQAPKGRSSWSEYALETSRSGAQPQQSTSFDLASQPYPTPFSYGYQEPRNQACPNHSALALDRTPFSSLNHHKGHLGGSYPQIMEMNDGKESKQRKRRGNLPKETTDKLRTWFVAHLQHPYPTEDEKQELMRQTGLQMNQISNWFINARRRQLPAMINNAKVESDARSARVGDRSEDASEYGDEVDKRTSIALGDSEGERSSNEEDFDQTRSRRGV